MAAVTRWQANTGRAQHVEETAAAAESAPLSARPRRGAGAGRVTPPGLPPGLSALETEDLLLALVLYLLYRESGDGDFLLLLAGTLLG